MSYASYLQPRHGLRPDAMHIVCLRAVARPMPQKLVDRLPWWLDLALQGEITASEAAAAYGEHPTGGGRPRRFLTFADYITDRIRYAEDEVVADQLRVLLARSARTGRRSQALSAATVRVNRMLAETGKDRANQLRALLAELADATSAVPATI